MTRAEPLFASRGFFEDVLFPSWLEFFRTDGGYAWSGYGSCKSKTNVTIPCPASLYGATDVLYSVFAVGLLDEMPKKQKEKLEGQLCRCGWGRPVLQRSFSTDPRGSQARPRTWAAEIQSFQDPDSGRFRWSPGSSLDFQRSFFFCIKKKGLATFLSLHLVCHTLGKVHVLNCGSKGFSP